MLSKNESFKPPKEYEEWANSEFTNVLDYMCYQKVNFDGTIFLQWLAVPYISIWFARSTKDNDKKIWIMHNLEFSDYIIAQDINTPREAIIEFSKKWNNDKSKNKKENTTLRVRNNNREKLQNHSQMLLSVGNDLDLWEEDII